MPATHSQNFVIGLVVNPVAGMGGSVGLKGTDGNMHRRSVELGANPVSPGRTEEFLSRLDPTHHFRFLTAPGLMGADFVAACGLPYQEIGSIPDQTSRDDTRGIARKMLETGIDLLVFVGGDGTARDICDAVGLSVPVVGVPSGVKVYSSVFAVSPVAAAAMVEAFLNGAEVSEEEVLDIDEEAFRQGRLDSHLYGSLLVPEADQFRQAGKEASPNTASGAEARREIAAFFAEEMAPDTLYLLGPGTTVKALADAVNIENTLLGVDAVLNGQRIGADLSEAGILDLLERHPRAKIVVTPLGGNGFIFGRGNKQFTPKVIRIVGRDNIMVVATADKISGLNGLLVDTGDRSLDHELEGFIDVMAGYHYLKMVRITL